MKKELRDEWSAALRSGKYIQGKGCLKGVDMDDQVKHCCLGVACEIFAERAGVKEYNYEGLVYFDKNRGCLPHKLMDFLGLYWNIPTVEFPVSSLNNSGIAKMNDSGIFSFNDIADIIDNDFVLPEHLFVKLDQYKEYINGKYW